MSTMDSAHRKKLVRQRTVAKSSLTRLQNFIETGERKLHELQARYEELPNIFRKFEIAQNELQITDDGDYSLDRESFEQHYFQLKAKFIELLHPVDSQGQSADNAFEPGNNQLPGLNHARHSRVKLPSIQLPTYDGTTSTWLHFRDTFDSLIIQNEMLSNVQKVHYLLSSLMGEAKQLIANLQISHDNFVVAWDLVTQRYNNIKLIAMTHVKQLLQLPQVKKDDATSLRHLINHVTSNTNAIQALALNTSKPSQAKPSQAKPSQAKPSQAKPSQAKVLTGAETCAKRKSTSPCLLAIPAFDRVAGLNNRHLNSNRGICLR